MRYYGLDLNLLTVLEALFVERHVTRAAGRLHLTQSAVSASLGRLREHFEDPLFVLVGGKMLPSPLMQALYPRIQTVLGSAREIASANVRFDPATASRRLRIMASDYVIAVLMPQVQRLLSDIAPQVELHLLTLTPLKGAEVVRTVDDALEQQHCDLVIIPHAHRSRHHPDEALFQDPFSVIACRDNPLVAEGLTLERYLSLPHVVRETGAQGQGSMEAEYLASMNLERRVAVSVEQFGLIPEFIEGSQCIATLHSRLARLYAKRFKLQLLEPPMAIPPTLQVVQWHAYQDVDPALIWMRQLLRDAAAKT
jgi:LysR family nod box-dependent transcriptional activator